MSLDTLPEARRQIEICIACRYCEGYCSVFPAMFKEHSFADGDITQLANLCHNCGACYYACPYTEPHEFAMNLPGILAEVRQESWKDHAWPSGAAGLFERSGMAMSASFVLAFMALFWAATAMRPASGTGFYAYMSHGLMVTIFTPAFLLPLVAIAVSMRRYWRTVGGGRVSRSQIMGAMRDAGEMKNLAGGQGQGCNFEDEDRFSNTRRRFHHATLYGFLLCFASTSSGTVLHYGFGLEAPYGVLSLPKLLGLPGGVLLCIGTAGLAWLKTKADPKLGAPSVWGGEMAFVVLLFTVSFTGLALYAATDTVPVPPLLALHLATVLTFFLLMPYSKMVHGFYRMAALIRDRQKDSNKAPNP